MTIPSSGWPLVAWWAAAIAGAVGLAAVGQPHLSAVLIGGVVGATVPRVAPKQ